MIKRSVAVNDIFIYYYSDVSSFRFIKKRLLL
jgi:hypothetical protein